MLSSIAKTVGIFALIISMVMIGLAQSTDRDKPTKLTSPEISGFVDSRSAGSNYYYSFVAGPGEVTITLDVFRINYPTSTKYEIFDEDARPLLDDDADTMVGTEQRKVKRFVLSRKASLILRISPGYIWKESESGKFRLRFNGAVDLSGATTASCLPKQGLLRIKMKDGSIKEIDLKQTDEITIQP